MVVEGTFGWMVRWRRLMPDHEARLNVSKAFIHVTMGSLLLRRISHPQPFSKGLHAYVMNRPGFAGGSKP
jgi:hypothetical protein